MCLFLGSYSTWNEPGTNHNLKSLMLRLKLPELESDVFWPPVRRGDSSPTLGSINELLLKSVGCAAVRLYVRWNQRNTWKKSSGSKVSKRAAGIFDSFDHTECVRTHPLFWIHRSFCCTPCVSVSCCLVYVKHADKIKKALSAMPEM